MPVDVKEPKVLYHYTTMDAMMKIVKSSSIWATNVEYLNDISELQHFLTLVRNRLPEFFREQQLKQGPYWLDDSEDHDLGKWFTPPEERLPLRKLVFISSFSREADSLPQWRSYCPDGNGVSIGFKVAQLKRGWVVDKALTDDGSCYEFIDLEAVDYVDETMTHAIDAAIANAIATARAKSKYCIGVSLTPEERSHALFNGILRSQACTKKHLSFRNELEYRLIVQPTAPPGSKVLEFRSTHTTLLPFVVVHLESPFIEQVVVGPTNGMDLSLQAVSAFFAKNAMTVKVKPSTIPFRDIR